MELSANAALWSWIFTWIKPFPTIWPAQLQPASNSDCILLLAKGKKPASINPNNSYVFLSYTYLRGYGGVLAFKEASSTVLVPKNYRRFKNNNNKKIKRVKKCFSSAVALVLEIKFAFSGINNIISWPCIVHKHWEGNNDIWLGHY